MVLHHSSSTVIRNISRSKIPFHADEPPFDIGRPRKRFRWHYQTWILRHPAALANCSAVRRSIHPRHLGDKEFIIDQGV
ncbi:hypothetical protein T4A_6145 [Trichinella pseudospiralis]|uniref:Uncharacterized protein n=1 Tax=Trichinella pseudospiralis TaxID=6337 RepID=A0A0V1DTK7_TRIPS|nr:hypothetical protein T4A_6145 [Trichinella pseudospiralis]